MTYGGGEGSSLTSEAKPDPPRPLQASGRVAGPRFPLLFSPRWVLTHQRKAVRIQRARGPPPTAPPSPPLATLWNGLSDQGT